MLKTRVFFLTLTDLFIRQSPLFLGKIKWLHKTKERRYYTKDCKTLRRI